VHVEESWYRYAGITIITPPAASPTQNVKLAMYRPQLTWSVMFVRTMPSRTCTAQAFAPTRATAVRTNIQV
jgi:hypothetical protein